MLQFATPKLDISRCPPLRIMSTAPWFQQPEIRDFVKPDGSLTGLIRIHVSFCPFLQPTPESRCDMSQSDAFDRVLVALGDATLNDALWPSTAGLIDEACGLTGNELVVAEGSADDVRIYFSRFCYRGQRRHDLERMYFNVYYPGDERIPRFRVLPVGKVVHVTELFTDQELETSLAYNEALRLSGSQNALIVRLDGPGGLRISWEFANTVYSDGWDSAQVEMIRRLLPHMRQYVRVRHALFKVEALGVSLTQLLGNARVGVVYVDWRGRILETNNRALDILRRGEGLLDQGGFLRTQLLADNTRLMELLANALTTFGAPATGASMTVRRPGGKPRLVLHVNPITTEQWDIGGWPVAALVLIVEPGNLPGIDPDLVAAVYGLTPAESRVAVMLAEGSAVRDIAAAMGCQENTVRYHAKQMHHKLGISRRAELVRLVLSLAGSSEFRR